MPICILYARDKTAVDILIFSLFCLWSIREGGLFKKVVYLVNLPAGQLDFKRQRKMGKTSLFNNSYSLQIYSLLIKIYKHFLKGKKVDLQAILLYEFSSWGSVYSRRRCISLNTLHTLPICQKKPWIMHSK